MSTPTQQATPTQQEIRKKYFEEVARLQQELKNKLEKLTLVVNEINGLKLVKEKDKEFDIISEALYCARRYWYDNGNEEYMNELDELDICAIIIKK